MRVPLWTGSGGKTGREGLQRPPCRLPQEVKPAGIIPGAYDGSNLSRRSGIVKGRVGGEHGLLITHSPKEVTDQVVVQDTMMGTWGRTEGATPGSTPAVTAASQIPGSQRTVFQLQVSNITAIGRCQGGVSGTRAAFRIVRKDKDTPSEW